MSENSISQLTEEVRANPGCDKFVELARLLSEDPERRSEAREVCFRGLAAQPKNRLGRLILARLFYLDAMYEFAARELAELRGIPDAPSVEKLLAEFGPLAAKYDGTARVSTPNAPASSSAAADDGVVAELDLEAGFIEALNELKEEQ